MSIPDNLIECTCTSATASSNIEALFDILHISHVGKQDRSLGIEGFNLSCTINSN